MEYDDALFLEKKASLFQNNSSGISDIYDIYDIDLENWMTNLPEELTSTPLIHLAIPGSHNSFTYTLSPKSEVSPDSPPFVQSLGRWCKPITNRLIYNWSQNQKKDVVQQLELGIRFFDMRLVIKDDDIHTSHGLYGSTVQDFLEDMRAFLDGHPKEVVIIDFQHFYEFYPVHHDRMVGLVSHIFGNKICRRERRMRENTLKTLWHNHSQIIIIYRNPITRFNELFWPSGTWETPWPNKIKIEDLLNYLNNGLNNRRDGMGFVSQGILTPTPKYIFLHFFGSLKSMANRANKKVISWLETKNPGANGINVVICDFIERHNFCQKVVLLNYKSLNVNQIPSPIEQQIPEPLGYQREQQIPEPFGYQREQQIPEPFGYQREQQIPEPLGYQREEQQQQYQTEQSPQPQENQQKGNLQAEETTKENNQQEENTQEENIPKQQQSETEQNFEEQQENQKNYEQEPKQQIPEQENVEMIKE